jgi:radical SAM superfamily enzyme YgiQ (UPF0313 family)
MNVLMINPNLYRPHASPVGLEYVCNSLLREKIDFDVVDFNFEPEDVVYDKLRKNNVELVGITVRDSDSATIPGTKFFIPAVKTLVERIKNTKDCKVVLGGAGFSVMPQEIMEYTGADFGVVRYGEEALPKLLQAIRAGGNLSQIDNLIWRKNGKFQVNPISTGDYENIPPRRRNIVRNRSYDRVYGIGNIEEKRGCPQNCGYCCELDIVGGKVVTRKISYVIEEARELRSLGIKHLYFCDSEFNLGDQKFLFDLCEQLVKSKVGITWTVSMHPDPETMPQKLLNLMKDAGCQEVLLTADSGSNEILESMGKQHTAEDTVKCSELIHKANMRMVASYLAGWPGESTQTLGETFAHIKRCRFEGAAIFAGVRIFPNTKLARIAMDEGLIREDTQFLNPIFYQPERVLREFIPFIQRNSKNLSNCMYPTRAVDFLNLLIRNVYLRGDFTCKGYADFLDHMNSLSRLKKLKLFGRTALDYILPYRVRFIPNAEEGT